MRPMMPRPRLQSLETETRPRLRSDETETRPRRWSDGIETSRDVRSRRSSRD